MGVLGVGYAGRSQRRMRRVNRSAARLSRGGIGDLRVECVKEVSGRVSFSIWGAGAPWERPPTDYLKCISCAVTVGGQPVRSLFTPFDARAHFILGTDCGRHGGRLKNPRTLPHARAPSACGKLRGSLRLQGVRAQSVPRSRRAATRATAAPRPERTNKAFVFAAWKGGVRCSDAVQAMAAWLARCGRVPVQRAARSHATVSGSPIREELGR